MNRFDDILSSFDTYELNDEKAISLMNRIDKKYVFHIDQLNKILRQAKKKYKRLKIGDSIIPSYETTYYDTDDFFMYTTHHNGKLNRYKVRNRKYLDSTVEFLEIKFKNNKNITDKNRIRRFGHDNVFNDNVFSREERDFIAEHIPYKVEELQTSLYTSFKRITLTNFETKERITIDGNLRFTLHEKAYSPKNLIICEVKKEPGQPMTDFDKILRNLRIKAFRVSKYCLGNYYLNDNVKHNLYKEKAIYINNITKVK